MIRTAVVGAGQFGRNHCRVVHESPRAQLAFVVDSDPARAAEAAAQYGAEPLTDFRALAGQVDAAIVATPTTVHEEVASALLDAGIDVLVEKPIAPDLASAARLIEARRAPRPHPPGRATWSASTRRSSSWNAAPRLPLFFEVHRLNLFSPRSLDVDVVLDLMIHDVDIVLALTGAEPEEIRAAGVRILSQKVDIANVRLQFPNGCIANLTASRISTERVRKLRLFQPQQYLSLDYTRQDLAIFSVGANRQIGFEQAPVTKSEPLQLQFDCVSRQRGIPKSAEMLRAAPRVNP